MELAQLRFIASIIEDIYKDSKVISEIQSIFKRNEASGQKFGCNIGGAY